MISRFDYVSYDEQSRVNQAIFKNLFCMVEGAITSTLASGIPGRSVDLALTALEESYMWIGKAIRDDQIERNNT